MIEGDRITVRCDLEAFVYDTSRSNAIKNDTHKSQTHLTANLEFMQNSQQQQQQQQNFDDDNESLEENDEEEDDENMVDGSSSDQDQQDDYDSLAMKRKIRTTTSTTTTTTTPTIAPLSSLNALPNYHCRGEGLPGRTTRWSALAAPSCRGKWLRLTLRTPKKCTHAQFIYV
uniref:Uncharacterized protein n=1 Tax=Glossina brevipalpis TaxID=37001 RepID=A0A1A9WAI0_9MUSC